MTSTNKNLSLTLFPFLQDIHHWVDVSRVNLYPKGMTLLIDGEMCESVLLVLDGAVRVYKISHSGRELTLYRVVPGETCVLLLSSIMANQAYPASAIAEQDTLAISVPAPIFQKWMQQSSNVQDFVYSILHQRLLHVMLLIEEIVFRKMDLRCADYLLKQSSPDHPHLLTTHDEMAADLGSAREVISRILKEFEKEGLVSLSRGSILISNREGIKEKILRADA